MNRRDVLLGGSLVAAAGAAAALQPRQRLVLLENRKLEDIVPAKIGAWATVPSNAFVLPKSPGSLADRLYSQTMARLYASPSNPPVMLVIAYGAVQNDLLQLHRPEACYTAVGYVVSGSHTVPARLGPNSVLPVRELSATTDTREEQICYWTRIGDDLPTDGSSQRWVKLRQQMRGYLSDGVLVRMSTVGEPTPEVFAQLRLFATSMVAAMAPANRAILIGRPLASAIGAAPAAAT
ncbi:MAG: EpsI family protein [Alphaproteobacteria bacterium]|nr:MAG: EpsI family protein [Alphaproteobacteria bacterium]